MLPNSRVCKGQQLNICVLQFQYRVTQLTSSGYCCRCSSMHSTYLVLLALLASCSCVKAFTWTPCDADVVPFTPDHVDLVPDPPAAGGQVTFKIEGNAGLISINVTFAGTQIYEEVDDLCSKTSCPIKTGPIAITYVQDLPPIAPPGDYDVQVVARDLQNTELMCVVVHFEMLPPSFVQKFLPASWLPKGRGNQLQKPPATKRRLLQIWR